MPILKYRCNACGKEFAKISLTLAGIPKECPVCGAANPQEAGPAFEVEEGFGLRPQCTSCEDCSSEGCRPAASS
jgi:putative FmdB family regulatory protein